MQEPSKQITKATNGPTQLMAKYEETLKQYGSLENATLIPLADLPGLTAAIRQWIEPASPRQIDEAIALVAASWPHAHQKLDGGVMDLHVELMKQDFAGMPYRALESAVREYRRMRQFPPALSEIIEEAAAWLSNRQRWLRVADAHAAEHKRRQALRAPA